MIETGSHFAKPDRSSEDEIRSDHNILASEKLFLDVFGTFSGIAAIIDRNRQIVYGNNELLGLLGIESLDLVLGKRPGEAVSCIHSGENPSGCGTSAACRVCGAVNAIITSQETGEKTVREARITTTQNGITKSLDLKVTSSPLQIQGRQYYVFTMQDISNEKRKEILEKIFLHDLLNSAGSLNGILTMLKTETDPEEERSLIEMSEEASNDIIEEIIMHRKLRQAENGDLVPDFKLYKAAELVYSVVGKIKNDFISRNKEIEITEISDEIYFETDRMLFNRILTNLVKNALEATPEGDKMRINVLDYVNKVRFEVQNNLVMKEDVKHQIFQRSFSTKGTGRGTGTYSIKLLTENYLNGIAGFVSTEEIGTMFFVEFLKGK
jgi:signal transduction histidine kinase